MAKPNLRPDHNGTQRTQFESNTKKKAVQKNRQREESLAKILLLTTLVELIEKIIDLIEQLIK